MKANFWLFVLIGVVVLVGLLFAFKPNQEKITSQNVQNVTVSPKPSSTNHIFTLVVKDNKLVSGESVLKVKEGDKVTIKITSDEEEELHLHGYNKSIDLEPGKASELMFTADKTGRFAYELEHSKIDIGALEVEPR